MRCNEGPDSLSMLICLISFKCDFRKWLMSPWSIKSFREGVTVVLSGGGE